MSARTLWSRLLIIAGSVAMLVGAIDPMEGALLVFPGSGLVALGTILGENERRLILYRLVVFILIAIGVGALWGLSMAGGIGGKSGLSMWWGMLILPYLLGWSMGIWGPGSPRWLLLLGIAVGVWYLVLLGMILKHPGRQPISMWSMPCIVIAGIGLLTIGGCICRLSRRIFARQ